MLIWEYMGHCIHEAGRCIALAELMSTRGNREKTAFHLRKAQEWMDRAAEALRAEAEGRES